MTGATMVLENKKRVISRRTFLRGVAAFATAAAIVSIAVEPAFAALAATTIWECQTGGDDSNNGGAFDPGQTAGMFTDGAATVANTSAPVFTSASYNFVAGDVGAWLYLSSGTTGATVAGGWYKIASVAANAATLNATIGQAVLKTTVGPSTVVGCANGASPTVITWTIDYSQQAAAQFAYTDLASAGAGLTVSSAAKPFAKQQVGNSIVITAGTNFTAGRYIIASVAAAVATVVGAGNITTGAGASGIGGQGGALLSPALACGTKVANNQVFIKTGTYNITTASTNVAGGCIADTSASTAVGNHLYEGYGSVRGDLGTAPILLAGNAISTFTILSLATGGGAQFIRNITLDAASLTSGRGVSCARNYFFQKVTVKNCTNDGFNISAPTALFLQCVATGCGGTSGTHYGFNSATAFFDGCEAYSNTVGGFNFTSASIANLCLSYGNSGASSDGFNFGGVNRLTNCVAYGNGRDGFRKTNANASYLINCIGESNTGKGFGFTGSITTTMLLNCGAFGNGTDVDTVAFPFTTGFVTGVSSFFTNAAAGNFSLNSTAGAGAAARAAGFPGVYPSGTTTGFIDIGGAQHADPAGASSRVIGG